MKKDNEIQALKAMLGDTVTEAQIDAMLAAQEAIVDGSAVGTVVRDKDSGKVAHRVMVNGIAQWRVSGADGEQYNDLQPTLPWDVIYDVER